MRRERKEAIEKLAKQMWKDREFAFAWLMKKIHNVDDYKSQSWDEASEPGRNLVRRQARYYLENTTKH